MDYRLEVANIPVSDVDQAKQFYQGLGWRLDADFDLGGGTRIVQMTPPGSACSVSFGTKIPMAPELVVDDIEAARAELTKNGAEVSEPFHREGTQMRPGVDPKHQSTRRTRPSRIRPATPGPSRKSPSGCPGAQRHRSRSTAARNTWRRLCSVLPTRTPRMRQKLVRRTPTGRSGTPTS